MFERHVWPPAVKREVLLGTALQSAACPFSPKNEAGVGGLLSAPFSSRPAPTQDGPGAAPCVRRGQPQNSTVRLSRRAAVAPPVRTPSLPPWLSPSRSVVSSFSVLSLLPFLPRVPVGVPGTASDSSLPAARVSFPRGSSGGGGRGGGGGAGTISAATALVQLGCPSALSCRASGHAAPPPLLSSL